MKKLMFIFFLPIFLWGSNHAQVDPYATRFIVGENLEITFYTPTMFRIRTSSLTGEKFPKKYNIPFVIGKLNNWPPVNVKISKDDTSNYQVFRTDSLDVRFDPITGEWSVWKKGKQICPSNGPTYGMFRDGYSLFDNASFFNEVNSNSRYAHWFYNPETKNYTDTYLKEDLIKDNYFIYGPSYAVVYKQFNTLVGPEPLLPKKAYGFFQTQHLVCKGDQKKLMAVAAELRKKDIPCDNLIIDFEWGDGCNGNIEIKWGSSLDWSENYTQPLSSGQMLTKLDSMHFNVMLIHHNAPDFKNRAGQGWTESVFPEDIWWTKLKEKLDMGVDGIWQDTRKNDITDSRIWTGIQEYLGENKRVLFMGCRKMQAVNPWDFRFSVVPVNNIIGARRYPFDWTGDCSFNWNELRWQIKAITNSHGPLKGISYISSDGVGETWKIQARWNQFTDFTPVSRSHNPKPWAGDIEVANFQNKIKIQGRDTVTVKDTPDNKGHDADGISDGPSAENSIRKHRKLRYRLLPYIYSYAFENYLTGMPICRPMLLAYPDDYLCSSDTWPYQYMFGKEILVAPVYGDFKTMEIYLPRGYDWIDYWSKEKYKGGGVINYNTEDVEKLPLFVKAGAILPMRKEQNWIETGEIWDPLTLDIYPDSVSSFTLFEDDARSTNYQNGEYSKTVFECRQFTSEKITVNMSKSVGNYIGKPEKRTCILRVNLAKKEPIEVKSGTAKLKRVGSIEDMTEKKSVWLYDKTGELIIINTALNTSQETNIQIFIK